MECIIRRRLCGVVDRMSALGFEKSSLSYRSFLYSYGETIPIYVVSIKSLDNDLAYSRHSINENSCFSKP